MNKAEALSENELRDIARKMGPVSPREFLRAKTAENCKDERVVLLTALPSSHNLLCRPSTIFKLSPGYLEIVFYMSITMHVILQYNNRCLIWSNSHDNRNCAPIWRGRNCEHS